MVDRVAVRSRNGRSQYVRALSEPVGNYLLKYVPHCQKADEIGSTTF